jgi:hypothetical protein
VVSPSGESRASTAIVQRDVISSKCTSPLCNLTPADFSILTVYNVLVVSFSCLTILYPARPSYCILFSINAVQRPKTNVTGEPDIVPAPFTPDPFPPP